MTTGSNFLSLPFEVRSLVYHHLFVRESVSIGHNTSSPPPPARVLGILFANKICYQEARPVFYDLATFNLKYPRQTELEYPGATITQAQKRFGSNVRDVAHVCYYGKVPKMIDRLRDVFPSLRLFEMSLFNDFFHSDQTNFERAMRYVLRYGEWKHAIKDALDQRFPSGMRDAVAILQRMGPERGFKVRLIWRMGYRFVDFKGDIDLDDWVLRVTDPDGNSSKVYEIPQNPLEPTWNEERLTLPSGEL